MIEVPPEEWREFIDEAAGELSRDLKIEGFRPGHAPLNLIEQKIGMGHILEHAAEHCAQKSYIRAILDNKIEAIGKPEISVIKIAKDNPFEFKAKVAVMPEVQLPDYKKIAHDLQEEKKGVTVTSEEIEKSIEWLQKSRAKYITVPRACAMGDRVEIDFEGECEGQKLAELASKNHPAILGKGYFMPGFEENIIGMKEGEEKVFNLKFSEDFEYKHMAGKSVSFKTKMNLVQKEELSEINDDFAKSLGNFNDLSALKDSLREGLKIEKENAEKDRWRTKAIEKISGDSKMEIPQILLESEQKRMMDDLRSKISQIGLKYEQYLERFKKTESEILAEIEREAKKRVAAFLTIREIAKKEKIEPTEEEISEEANKALRHIESVKRAESKIDTAELKEYTKDVLKNEKVFELLESC